VLEREHQIISGHKALADLVIPADFGSVQAGHPARSSENP
jgi:hypothetical protein